MMCQHYASLALSAVLCNMLSLMHLTSMLALLPGQPQALPAAAHLAPAGTVHSVHLRDLKPGDLFAISRLRITNRDLEEPPPPPHRNPVVRALRCAHALLVPLAGACVVGFACAVLLHGKHGRGASSVAEHVARVLGWQSCRQPAGANVLLAARRWWRSWALPGAGMFIEVCLLLWCWPVRCCAVLCCAVPMLVLRVVAWGRAMLCSPHGYPAVEQVVLVVCCMLQLPSPLPLPFCPCNAGLDDLCHWVSHWSLLLGCQHFAAAACCSCLPQCRLCHA